MIAWDAQSGYANDLIRGSPEHNGAHARLLELAVKRYCGSEFEGDEIA
jgi:hypothetical protein